MDAGNSGTEGFEGVQYDLGRVAFLLNSDTAGNLQDVSGDTFIGDIKAFLDILVANANRVFGAGSWVVGDYPSGTSADTQLTFGPDDNCLSVLQTLCDTFGCEFSITTTNGVSTINMGTVGSTFPYALAYGRHHGLYELTRENCDGDNVVTRMYVYGGTKNLPPFYPCDRLLLRGTTYTITKRNSMLESATMQGRYGVFECVKIYDDVFPEREGEVTAVVQADVLKFTDSTMFDLNAKWADNTTDYNYYLSLSGRTDSTEVHNNYTANVVGTSKYARFGIDTEVLKNLLQSDEALSELEGHLERIGEKSGAIGKLTDAVRKFNAAKKDASGELVTEENVAKARDALVKAVQDVKAAVVATLGDLGNALKEIGQTLGNKNLEVAGDVLNDFLTNIQAAEAGAQAWGGWWGAVIGGLTDLIPKIVKWMNHGTERSLEDVETMLASTGTMLDYWMEIYEAGGKWKANDMTQS